MICELAKVESGLSHRGRVVAFSVFSWKGTKVEPTFVQKSQLDTIFLSSDATYTHISFVQKSSEERERLVEIKSIENESHNRPLTIKKRCLT